MKENKQIINHLSLNRLRKPEVDFYVEIATQSNDFFNKLINNLFTTNKILVFNSAWIIGYVGIIKPNWFLSRLGDIYHNLKPNTDDSVYRNISRVLMRIEISDKYQGIVTKNSIDWLSDNKMPIAVRAFCIHIISKIIDKQPYLCNEIRDIIESIIPNSSPGLLNAVHKLLKKINKMNY
ncbi:MAG: hypothetical protein IT243_00190 [Bacteroidia bacterium]|nr:hypothetical protein [Bacteroidia bacterium]